MADHHETHIQVRYGETDRMGVVYHANYLVYFEIGRTEWIRDLALPYSRLEEMGFVLMVTEATVRFKRPARYDDWLTIRTSLRGFSKVRLHFDYAIHRRGEDELIVEGHTVLACIDLEGRPHKLPDELRAVLGRVE